MADARAMAAAWRPASRAWASDGSGTAKKPHDEPNRARTPTPADWARATCSRIPSVADRSSVVMIMARASAYVAPAASAASTAALATSNMRRTLVAPTGDTLRRPDAAERHQFGR